MDDIATEAGFSRGLLYVYFKDKHSIYQAIRIRAVRALRARMEEYVEQKDTGIEKIEAVGRAFYDFYRFDPHFFNCISLTISLNNQRSEKDEDNGEMYKQRLEEEQKTMQVAVNALQTGIDDGTVDPGRVGNLMETALYMRGTLHGIILLQDRDGSQVFDHMNLDREAMIDNVFKRLNDSIRPLEQLQNSPVH